jgi:hypothetical protein
MMLSHNAYIWIINIIITVGVIIPGISLIIKAWKSINNFWLFLLWWVFPYIWMFKNLKKIKYEIIIPIITYILLVYFLIPNIPPIN